MSDRVDINRVLLEMRALKAQSQAMGNLASKDVAGNSGDSNVNGPKFGDVLAQAVNKVNEVRQASGALSQAYIQGDPKVDITDVMIASQKSSVAFEAMVQVRNKLVEAYKDVMNMPI